MVLTSLGQAILRVSLAGLIASMIGSPATAQDIAPTQHPSSRTEGIWRVSIGANYSRGDYGELIDTEVVSIPLALRYSKKNFRFRVSVPYIFLNGPGSLLDRPDGGGVDVGGAMQTERRQGFGDISISLGYQLPLGDGFALDANARVKLPTASRAKRLGTGKADATLGLDLVKDFNGVSLYAGGRRRFVGEPEGTDLRDVWSLGGGGSFRATPGVRVGADYVWRQSSQIGGGEISEISAWTSFRLNRRTRFTIYGGTGLTKNSSDFTGGTSLSYRL